LGDSSFDFRWAHFGLDEANDCSAGITLRFFMISPFMGDLLCLSFDRNSSQAMQAVAQEHATRKSVAAVEEAVVRTTPNGLWFGGVWFFVCVELAAAEWPKKRT
jgi:hypothetical protein